MPLISLLEDRIIASVLGIYYLDLSKCKGSDCKVGLFKAALVSEDPLWCSLKHPSVELCSLGGCTVVSYHGGRCLIVSCQLRALTRTLMMLLSSAGCI